MMEDIKTKLDYMATLNERQRRQFAALEANSLGWHGVSIVSEALKIHPHTIRRGKLELAGSNGGEELLTIRHPGGGRKKNVPSRITAGGTGS